MPERERERERERKKIDCSKFNGWKAFNFLYSDPSFIAITIAIKLLNNFFLSHSAYMISILTRKKALLMITGIT
jgi:hypothetical protein